MAISGSEMEESEGRYTLSRPGSAPGLRLDCDSEKIDFAIRKFKDVLQLNPNTFTKKQEAIFSLALKEAFYEVLDVPPGDRHLDEEIRKIENHEFW